MYLAAFNASQLTALSGIFVYSRSRLFNNGCFISRRNFHSRAHRSQCAAASSAEFPALMYLAAFNANQLTALSGSFIYSRSRLFNNRCFISRRYFLNDSLIILCRTTYRSQRSSAENAKLSVSEFLAALGAFSCWFSISLNGFYREELAQFSAAVNAEFTALACFSAFITYKHDSSIPDNCIIAMPYNFLIPIINILVILIIIFI